MQKRGKIDGLMFRLMADRVLKEKGGHAYKEYINRSLNEIGETMKKVNEKIKNERINDKAIDPPAEAQDMPWHKPDSDGTETEDRS